MLCLIFFLAYAFAQRLVKAPVLVPPYREVEYFGAEARPFNIIISLKQRNIDRLASEVIARSTPGFSNYGNHLSGKELCTLSDPPRRSYEIVEDWLKRSGILKIKAVSSSVHFTASWSTVERIFKTSIRFISIFETGALIVRARDYVIPAEIENHVSAIYGLHGLPLASRNHRTPKTDRSGRAKVVPSVIAATYAININGSGNTEVRQAVGEFQDETSLESDQKLFFMFHMPASTWNDYKLYRTVGSNNQAEAGDEASLDVQYIMGVAPGILTEFWGFQSMDFCLDLKNFTDNIVNSTDRPSVFSISYGLQANISSLGCSSEQVADIDNNFLKISSLGISVLISSGDSGSGFQRIPDKCQAFNQNVEYIGEGKTELAEGTVTPWCCTYATERGFPAWVMAEDPNRGYNYFCYGLTKVTGQKYNDRAFSGTTAPQRMWPSWPASSPWVTAVGATRFGDKGNEVASSEFGSGGGFSWDFVAGKWQENAISAFLSQAQLPPTSYFPRSGRGTPDVSALGEGYRVIVDRFPAIIGGTSASAPAWAAMVSLLNQGRYDVGKSSLGFLNPFLYSNPEAFTDITNGTDMIDRNGQPLNYGYNCTAGWDPVTGLGSPLFSKLLELAVAI